MSTTSSKENASEISEKDLETVHGGLSRVVIDPRDLVWRPRLPLPIRPIPILHPIPRPIPDPPPWRSVLPLPIIR
jgi:hypothetical protein